MRNLIFTLFICCFSKQTFAGCTGPTCSTDKKIGFGWSGYGIDSTKVKSTDSITFFLSGGNCYYLNNCLILLDEDTLFKSNELIKRWQLKFPCRYGTYIIKTRTDLSYSGSWRIILQPEPQKLDTFTILKSSIPQINYSKNDLAVYPIPSSEDLTIDGGTEGLKTVTILDLQGKSVAEFNINLNQITLPLNTIPRGVYIMRVATLAERIIIKRIILQ